MSVSKGCFFSAGLLVHLIVGNVCAFHIPYITNDLSYKHMSFTNANGTLVHHVS